MCPARLRAALHLARSTYIDASSTFDGTATDFGGTAARPLTTMTLPRREVVSRHCSATSHLHLFEGTISSFLDAASSFPNDGRCFLDDALTRSSNPARLLLAPTSMAASSTTTRLLSTTMAFLHGGRAWSRCSSGSAQQWRRSGMEPRLQQRWQTPPPPPR
jgi:hypothetical protein